MIKDFSSEVEKSYKNGIKPYEKAIKAISGQASEIENLRRLSEEIDRKAGISRDSEKEI